MKCFFSVVAGLVLLGIKPVDCAAQEPAMAFHFNKEKTKYVQFSGYLQIWARYTELNPGSLVNGSSLNSIADLSLRRGRLKIVVAPLEKTIVVFQLGPTNVNNLSKGETYMDLLDAYVDYKFSSYLSVGAGRSAWMGLSRYATGYAKTLMYETPLINLGDVSRTDINQRKLSIFVKGQAGRLDYRAAIASPYNLSPSAPQKDVAVFTNQVSRPNVSAYAKWQFLEKESNVMAQCPGTYLGKKKVFAVGIGAEYQKDAMWHINQQGDTLHDKMFNIAADVFYDAPLNPDNGTALTVYGSFHKISMGPKYTRILAIDNPATGIDSKTASFNGTGNGYPVFGTGNTFSVQAGLLLPYFFKHKNGPRLLPAAAIQYSKLDRLEDPMITYDLGLSLLLNGHSSKFVFNMQSRPIYTTTNEGALKVTDRKKMFVLMYHIAID
jgi:hypothetical protein